MKLLKGKTLQEQSHLSQRNHADEASDAGDIGVVQAQQGEDGVSLEEDSRGGWKQSAKRLKEHYKSTPFLLTAA